MTSSPTQQQPPTRTDAHGLGVEAENAGRPASREPAAPGGDVRLDVLSGDRLCAKCCFNLAGQTIVREPHYGLLIVRCPECGTPAALQEYPFIGPWVNRARFLIAAVWFVVLLGTLAAFAGFAAGLAYSITEELTDPYQRFAYAAAEEHMRSMTPAGPQPQNASYNSAPFDQAWWYGLPPSKLFQEAGGWSGAIDWHKLWYWCFIPLIAIPFGVFWSVALPKQPAWRLAIVPLFALGLGATFVALAMTDHSNWGSWAARHYAFRQVAWPLHFMTLGAFAVLALAALAMGRPVARWAICILLPPRLRGPLSFLWIADGKPLPRP